jgi:hypothetical protein
MSVLVCTFRIKLQYFADKKTYLRKNDGWNLSLIYEFSDITVLLSLTVFHNIVQETLPQVSDSVPVIGISPPLSILHFFFLYFRVFLSFYSMGGVYIYMYELCLCYTCPEVLLYNISTMCTLYNIYAISKFVPIRYT